MKKYIMLLALTVSSFCCLAQNPDPTADQPGDKKREIEFSSPTIEYTMNWGHGGNNDMTFFSPSGDWGNNPYNWIYDRHIICNFNQ